MLKKLPLSWKNILNDELEKEYFKKLISFVEDEYSKQIIYPPQEKIFRAFELCNFQNINVVIIGQDPYHGAGQSNGLCFSVSDGIKIPPSLRNIYKALNIDIGKEIPKTGNVEYWAKQGILMLNATLTVRAGQPNSHQGKGWGIFTDKVIEQVSLLQKNVVFLLWGAFAQQKAKLIDSTKHYILKAPHPSPFSAHKGFFECKHFSKANSYLQSNGKDKILW